MTEKPDQSVEPAGVPELYYSDGYLSTPDDTIGSFINLENPDIVGNAICNAVSNTYGKGINPEAVPDLVEALKEVYEVFVDISLQTKGQSLKTNGIFIRLSEALKKAELK